MKRILDKNGGWIVCPCMVEKSAWYKMPAYKQIKVANRILFSSRKCPNCRLRGCGEWGEISKRDRDFFEGVKINTPFTVRFFMALRSSFKAFRRVIRGNSTSYILPAEGSAGKLKKAKRPKGKK